MGGFDPSKPEWTRQPFHNGSIQSDGDGRIGRDELHDKLKDVNTGAMGLKATAWSDAKGTLELIAGAVADALTQVRNSWKSDGAQLAYDRLDATRLSAVNLATASGEIGAGIRAIADGVNHARGQHGASSENFGDEVYNFFGGDGNIEAATAVWTALLADVNSGLNALPTELETQLKSSPGTYNAPVYDPGAPQIPSGVPGIGPGGSAPGGGAVPTGSIATPPTTNPNSGAQTGAIVDSGFETLPGIETWPPGDPGEGFSPGEDGGLTPDTGTIGSDPSRLPGVDTSTHLAGAGAHGASGAGFGGFGASGGGAGGFGGASGGFGGANAGAGGFGAGAPGGGGVLAAGAGGSGLSGRGGSGLAGSGSAGGGGSAGSAAAAGGRGMVGAAPMGVGRGMGGGADDDERERTTWLSEDKDVWGRLRGAARRDPVTGSPLVRRPSWAAPRMTLR